VRLAKTVALIVASAFLAGFSHQSALPRGSAGSGPMRSYSTPRILSSGAGQANRTASPLTPALSPLRGEGARRAILEDRTSFPACGEYGSERCPNAARPDEPPSASAAPPSPLKGERAGVRGENARDLPCNRLRVAGRSLVAATLVWFFAAGAEARTQDPFAPQPPALIGPTPGASLRNAGAATLTQAGIVRNAANAWGRRANSGLYRAEHFQADYSYVLSQFQALRNQFN